MGQAVQANSPRRDEILDAAIQVFGRYGFRKTSVEDLASAAQISKQGLYLHFASKEEIFVAAMRRYLDDGLAQVRAHLARKDAGLYDRLMGAMDAWFGRHLATYTPEALDVIEAGKRLSAEMKDEYSATFQSALAKALSESVEFKRAKNICSPKEVAQVLYLMGVAWKEGHPTRDDFAKKISICIRACCQVRG
ncbi:MAG TPA: TetR/AcrR family transcriptional regulator [Rhizomicrobium sp.]|jgi:AcrR family transcriptional regulator